MTICLIDYDPIKYAAASMCEKYDKDNEITTLQPVANLYYLINSMIKKCIRRCESRQYECFITPLNSKDNFRFTIYPDYKANRKDKHKPYYLKDAQEYGLTRWKAIESSGEEADDTLSIRHYSYHDFGISEDVINTVICSIDKDFDNCAGWHYNPKKDEFYFISEIQALRNFYLQILTGDVSDNIPRVKKGWRQKETEEKIQKALTEQELYDIVFEEVYKIAYDDTKDTIEDCPDIAAHVGLDITYDFIKRNGQLVWLRRKENELWIPNLETKNELS